MSDGKEKKWLSVEVVNLLQNLLDYKLIAKVA